jgi:hypothetical protein
MTRSTRYRDCLDCGGRHAEDEICPAGLERSAADGRMADAKLVPSGLDSEMSHQTPTQRA